MVEVPVDTLQASEERFRMLVDSVRGYAIFMLDVAGRVTTWNLGAVRTKGWRADEIIGQPYEVFFTAEDRAAGLPAQLLARAMVEGELEELGWRVRKDGSRFRASALLSAVRSSTGEHCGFAKITRDLTEQLEPAEVTRRYGNEQIRRLQQLIAALSHVASPEAVAQVVLEQSLRALEAHAGVLFLMASDEHTLVLLDQRGYPDGQLDGFEQIDIDAGNPPSEAARTRTPIFHETRETTLWRIRSSARSGRGPRSRRRPSCRC